MRAKNKTDTPFSIRGVLFQPGTWVEFNSKVMPPEKLAMIEARCEIDDTPRKVVVETVVLEPTEPAPPSVRASMFHKRAPKRKRTNE